MMIFSPKTESIAVYKLYAVVHGLVVVRDMQVVQITMLHILKPSDRM